MQTETMGYVVGGELQLDHKLELPDHSRVRVVVETAESHHAAWQQALTNLQELIRTQPISSHGLRFTRDELHERG